MSKIVKVPARKSVNILRKAKLSGQRLSMVTCYDATFAKLVDESAVDMILVGDSLGNVMLGLDSTVRVTLDMMVMYTQAVTRVAKTSLIAADMPFLSYYNRDVAIASAGRLLQEGGAQCVKLEGGAAVVDQVRFLVDNDIPVIGHLGYTEQHINRIGGHLVQGKSDAEAERILADAEALEAAGACALVLEMVPPSLAAVITQALSIPTIGIGAGPACDGQVLVLQDLLGLSRGFHPRFLKKFAELGQATLDALKKFDDEVKMGKFPAQEHCYDESTLSRNPKIRPHDLIGSCEI